MIAIEYSSFKVITYLSNNGANLRKTSYQGETPLMVAAAYASPEVIDYLLKSDINVNARDNDGNTALYYAFVHHAIDNIKTLIKGEANINVKNNAHLGLLHLNQLSCPSCVETLLKSGANPNLQDNNGNTPLMSEILGQNVNEDDTLNEDNTVIIDLLLQYGANPNIANNNMITPLMLAINHHHLKIIESLLGAGAQMQGLSEDYRKRLNNLRFPKHREKE